MDNKLNYSCRLALTQGGNMRTSTDIGLSYRSPYYFTYEKKETPRIPNVEIKKPFAMSDTYSTTYNLHYYKRQEERDLSNLFRKFRFLFTQYPKISPGVPRKFTDTEYKEEYPEKPLPPPGLMGRSVEQLSSCPMVVIGRDERPPLALTDNVSRHLDIYVTTMRQDYRAYSELEQKRMLPDEGTADFPQDLENRDPNMVDVPFSTKEFKPRYSHIPLPIIPSGWHSEYQTEYMPQRGYAKRHLFDPFVEYPERKIDSATQNLCPPGMYLSDYDAINKHTSPQTVV